MSSVFVSWAFLGVAVFSVIVGAMLIIAGVVSLARLKPFAFTVRALSGLLLFTLGLLFGVVALGTQGYHALTREEVAASIRVVPTGPQRFAATVRFPGGREARYDVLGDEIYVDARIVKWKPVANLLGLHTAYELDRLAGRYRAVEQERAAQRTVHALGYSKPLDVFRLRQEYSLLGPLLDAEYGSATYVPVSRPADLEVRVSTTGLLMREVSKP